jgi:hypothetical protein
VRLSPRLARAQALLAQLRVLVLVLVVRRLPALPVLELPAQRPEA